MENLHEKRQKGRYDSILMAYPTIVRETMVATAIISFLRETITTKLLREGVLIKLGDKSDPIQLAKKKRFQMIPLQENIFEGYLLVRPLPATLSDARGIKREIVIFFDMRKSAKKKFISDMMVRFKMYGDLRYPLFAFFVCRSPVFAIALVPIEPKHNPPTTDDYSQSINQWLKENRLNITYDMINNLVKKNDIFSNDFFNKWGKKILPILNRMIRS